MLLLFYIVPSSIGQLLQKKMKNNQVFIFCVNSEKMEDGVQRVNTTSTEIKTIKNDASYWSFLHIVTIICISAIQLPIVMLVPRHNSIIYPSYWFEIPVLQFYICIALTVNIIMSIYLFTNRKELLKITSFLKFYLVNVIFNIVALTLAYFLWVIVLEKNHPIPFLGLIIFFAGMFAALTGIFLAIPSDLLKDFDFQAKLRIYLKYFFYWYFIQLQKGGLSTLFKKLPSNFQFVIAFIIPLLRQYNKRVLSQFVNAMAGKEDDRANVWMNISLSIHDALFITICLAGAENVTVFSINTIGFIFHLLLTYNIIKADRRLIRQRPNEDEDENERENDKKQRIQKLILAETIEGIVPMCYAIGLIMAYYGPNSRLLGNVGSSIWAYEEVVDVERQLKVIFGMFGIDVLSVLLNSICLSKYGNINLIQDFLKFIQKYWLLLGIKLGGDLMLYFAYNDINLAMDMTFEFSWITDEGRMNFINSSTELTDDDKESLLSSFDWC